MSQITAIPNSTYISFSVLLLLTRRHFVHEHLQELEVLHIGALELSPIAHSDVYREVEARRTVSALRVIAVPISRQCREEKTRRGI